ncbi:hypothetical protein [Streptomyces sp. NPDC020607]|uniref:hypothetical protein n=1 Tax=Streptomyces sp. NPDC020607 TaxID=3365082 RepID=UPI0037B400C3
MPTIEDQEMKEELEQREETRRACAISADLLAALAKVGIYVPMLCVDTSGPNPKIDMGGPWSISSAERLTQLLQTASWPHE